MPITHSRNSYASQKPSRRERFFVRVCSNALEKLARRQCSNALWEHARTKATSGGAHNQCVSTSRSAKHLLAYMKWRRTSSHLALSVPTMHKDEVNGGGAHDRFHDGALHIYIHRKCWRCTDVAQEMMPSTDAAHTCNLCQVRQYK